MQTNGRVTIDMVLSQNYMKLEGKLITKYMGSYGEFASHNISS